ncbi:hypothetical protein DUT91_14895 [Phyllobacterium salinisoli]|uniref:Uncharacterized protein n=1 Tax=Phyllobacterium salinisoli TaxID=1899321 RepID=A0A368K0P0_9HYPH|nr:hypothetical protein DUT91_14895 [Phyllobacterium salinisoli]
MPSKPTRFWAKTLGCRCNAANGMPFWAFILMAIGCTAFAIGYTIFLDWITSPGAEDPFARYRSSDR